MFVYVFEITYVEYKQKIIKFKMVDSKWQTQIQNALKFLWKHTQ